MVFQETKNTAAYPLLIEKYQQIRVEFDIEWPIVEWGGSAEAVALWTSSLAVHVH